MSSLGPGSRIGRFEIKRILGEGAMGSVYLAEDPQIERTVAIKVLRIDLEAEHAQEIAARFQKEAKLAGRLQHPNIVTIYEAGRDGKVDFIAMEYVDGEPLNDFVASRPDLPLVERVKLVRQVALALEQAHERGVIHRDIKPGNILVSRDGHVKVADFGIGKLLTATVEMTRTGQMIGSPAYMSPEQVRGDKIDGRSDFFSLGVVFYELLTGSRPFPGDTITTLVYQILNTEPRDPLTLRADLPPSTRKVFARMLAKSPEKRPRTAADFLREVDEIESELKETDRTHPLGAPGLVAGLAAAIGTRGASARKGSRRSRERPAAFGAAYLVGGLAVVLAAALAVALWRRSGAAPQGGGQTPAAVSAPTEAPAPSAPPVALPAVAAPAVAATAEPAASRPVERPTAAALPTRGPRKAADASVGAPRNAAEVSPARVEVSPARAARAPSERARRGALPLPSAPEPQAPSARAFSPDVLYRTRHSVKFGVSPDQARVYLDGRYVGIADDWDDRGGGKTLELSKEGSHRVRLELPGYRTLNLEIIASPSANEETVEVGDELKRESKADYPKIPKVNDRTTGPVEFTVDPSDAEVSEGGRVLGRAFSFGPDSPLRLPGPMVHDLVLSAPGRKPRTLRILVASNADRDRAKVKVELKKQ